MTTAPPCSAALPTIATITAAMKNSLAPIADAKPLSECTRISLTSAVATVASASTPSASGSGHAAREASARSSLRVAAEVAAGDDDVEHEQRDRDRDRDDDGDVALGRSRVAEDGRRHEQDDGSADEPEL